jgi:hypothetical protein
VRGLCAIICGQFCGKWRPHLFETVTSVALFSPRKSIYQNQASFTHERDRNREREWYRVPESRDSWNKILGPLFPPAKGARREQDEPS